MTSATLKQGTAKELRKLFAMLASSMGETIGSLISKPVKVRLAEPMVVDVDAYVAALPTAVAMARGALDKVDAGKKFLTIVEVHDAIALAGLLMIAPEQVIEQRRASGVLEGEDDEAFGELGNVLYSGLGNVLRGQVGNVDIRFQDHVVVKPGLAKDGSLGIGNGIVFPFALKVGDQAETQGALAIDFETAAAWNKAPLAMTPAAGDAAADDEQPEAAARTADDEGLESIPQVEIRGALAAFLADPDLPCLLHKSCRRVGLELRRYGRGEIPNPAAHRNEIVLIDVPLTEDKRFDWCRRIKEFSPTTKVALLLHHPSRPRVTRAFLAKADLILGYPCKEAQLSAKLQALLEPAPETPTV
ncbi:MAG: hypothetical protein FJ301_09720 [Planctomycetes bacterium]|nr:hypothetical protein [Planctomycetota bacterium]